MVGSCPNSDLKIWDSSIVWRLHLLGPHSPLLGFFHLAGTPGKAERITQDVLITRQVWGRERKGSDLHWLFTLCQDSGSHFLNIIDSRWSSSIPQTMVPSGCRKLSRVTLWPSLLLYPWSLHKKMESATCLVGLGEELCMHSPASFSLFLVGCFCLQKYSGATLSQLWPHFLGELSPSV